MTRRARRRPSGARPTASARCPSTRPGTGRPATARSTPRGPFTGITVGASTQFGGTGWDSIKNASQIPDNDVIPWSDRGPGATGAPGIDVVGDGAFSAGDVTLNAVLDGPVAWETWGGTSRSSPVVTAASALVYQAQKTFGPIPDGFAIQARAILKSSALDLGYDAYTQGAGSVQAGEAVKATLGKRVVITPDAWRPGDYRGTEYDVFTHLLAPGASDSQTFKLDGPGTYGDLGSDPQPGRLPDVQLELQERRQGERQLVQCARLPDRPVEGDQGPSGCRPDGHPGDLPARRVRSGRRLRQRPALDAARLQLDRRQPRRRLWKDKNHNGVVNHTDSAQTNIDGDPLIDYPKSEIEKGEYVRLSYLRTVNPALQVMVRDPAKRLSSGIFLGLVHPERSLAIPITHFKFRVDFYKNVDWGWVKTPRSAKGAFTARINVPKGTPAGLYQGAHRRDAPRPGERRADRRDRPGKVKQAADGSITGSLTFGGKKVANAQSNLTYNNGSIFGANDWSWRAESGDWRFFYFDVPKATPEGTLFLADTTWDDPAPYTDLDTLIFGPSANSYQLFPAPITSDGSPYVLGTVGASPNTNIGAGIWTFQTATGGAEDVVVGPASEGLHAVVEHGTGWNGDKFHVPFTSTVGTATVNPANVAIDSAGDTGAFDVTFTSGVDLPVWRPPGSV